MWDNVKDLEVQFLDYEFNFYENNALVFCTTKWSGLIHGKELDMAQK
jgi:hypothetical protein